MIICKSFIKNTFWTNDCDKLKAAALFEKIITNKWSFFPLFFVKKAVTI